MKNAIIIHGFGATINDNFFLWLKKELEKLDYNVVLKNMPETTNPTVSKWLNALEDLKNEFTQQSIVIAHSLGGAIIPYFLDQTDLKIKNLFLVAPANPLMETEDNITLNNFKSDPKNTPIVENIRKFINLETNWQKLRQNIKNILVFMSDNDYWVPLSSRKYFEKSNIPIEIIEGKQHFSIPKFEELLQKIKEL